MSSLLEEEIKTTVEVFKTNVDNEQSAFEIIQILKKHFPHAKVNFDLDDCDKILRVESKNGKVDPLKIIDCVVQCRHRINILKD
jgi:hypothetical protein